MKAEHAYHVGRDQLVSPKRIRNTTTGERIEKRGQAAGQEGERQEKEGERQEKKEKGRMDTVLHPLRRCLEQCVRWMGHWRWENVRESTVP